MWALLVWLAVLPAWAGPPLAPAKPAPAGVSPDLPSLESLGDGRLRHRGAGFVATIRADGSVEFRDIIDRDFKLGNFSFSRMRFEVPVDLRDPNFAYFQDQAMFGGGGGRAGGMLSFRIRDPSDWTLGQRHVAAKRAFLEATARLRMRISYSWRRARMQEQLAALGDHLVAVWRDPKRSPAERRRALFVLWDDCAELIDSSPSPFDALYGAAGQMARAKISAFVRLVAPKSRRDAYTSAELARLNVGRKSRARFDPYRGESSPAELPELPPEPASAPAPDAPAAEPLALEPPAYGPTPGTVVTLPAPEPEPVQPAQKPRREHKSPGTLGDAFKPFWGRR